MGWQTKELLIWGSHRGPVTLESRACPYYAYVIQVKNSVEAPLSLSSQFGEAIFQEVGVISVSGLDPHPEYLCLGPSQL